MSVVLRMVLVLGAVFLAFPAFASARIVQCGEVITSDTRVDNDLHCATPVALEIGAHGVDLDLRGHTIEAVEFADENGSYYDEGDGLIVPGYDDVSVANGTIIGASSLGYGVRADDAERLSLRRLSISGYGSLVVRGDAVRIDEVTTRGFSSWVVSNGATIKGLTTHTELDVFGQAVEVADGNFGDLTIFHVDGSSFTRNVSAEWNVDGGGNSLIQNRGGRWHLSGGDGNTVRRNRITQGLSLGSGFSGSLVRDNTVSGSADFDEADGISVAAGATGNRLENNSVSGSADDGIDVEDPSTTLIGNRAFGNGDLGIEAVTGVIDGGGNRAWDNGNPLQCVNVQCER